ncbi:hypothetical protein WDH52_20440 [Streptomyces sp. TRM70308]|uniref:hypothetical protein n=1 Tax=Streptomyces sp. TRM70308 TaxID=3131932 RepID=UPI003D06A664
MKQTDIPSDVVLASPIALRVARELAEEPRASALAVYRTAVEVALSFSTGSARGREDESDPVTDQEAATRLAECLRREDALGGRRGLTFPQAVVSAADDAPMRLTPPQVASSGAASLLGKPPGALWTSSFLTPDYPAWTAMVDTGYVPVRRPFACTEFLADPDEVEIFTIDSGADFGALCDEFAVASGHGFAVVDWRKVAAAYHAVRLTVSGLLLAQEVTVHSRHGAATLRGWDSECTAWLRLPESARLGKRRLLT